MRRLLILLFSLLLNSPTFAAFQYIGAAARPAAMGGAFCAVTEAVHGCHPNPAATGYAPGMKVAMNYCRPFGLDDLGLLEIGLLKPIPGGVIGLGGRRFGNQLYRELTLSLSWARPLGDRGALGVRLRGLQLAIRGYGSEITWCLDVGAIAALMPGVRCGLWVRNLSDGRLGAGKEGMPQTVVIGLAYRLNSRVLLSADLLEDISDSSREGVLGGYPMEIRLGQEFHFLGPLCIRAGILDPPIRFSAGMGLRAGPLHLDYAWLSHQLLGGTHYFSMTWP
jgi:hypothetical protein